MRGLAVIFCATALRCLSASAAVVEIPAQSFDAGGWGLDVQFMDVMGSPYLIAHGKGIPVTDAKAIVDIPEDGAWRVWVRARKWVDGAGSFNVRIGGIDIGRAFGASQSEWAWEDGGEVVLRRGKNEVRLIDSDGFDGVQPGGWWPDYSPFDAGGSAYACCAEQSFSASACAFADG